MSKEKQIEEMARVIKSSLDDLGSGNFNFTGYEISTMFAKALYKAGYGKQSEGEWIERPDLQGFVCSNGCGEMLTEIEEGETLAKFCPNCGAKMDGRRDT